MLCRRLARKRRGPFGIVLLVAAHAGCVGSGVQLSPDLTVDTLASGRVLITAGPDVGRDRTASLQAVTEVGGVDAGPGAFGRVIDVLFHGETIYVADVQSASVSSFGVDGSFVRSWGGRGEGPGEFVALSGVLIDATKTLWAEDQGLKRLTGFRADGTVVTTPNVQQGWGGNVSWLGVLSPDGTLLDYEYFSGQLRTNEGRARGSQIVRASLEGGNLIRLDSVTLPLHERPSYQVRRQGYVEVAPPPFWPSRLTAIAPDGTVWINDQADYVVHRIDFKGDTLATIKVRMPPEQVSSHQLDSASRATGIPKHAIPDEQQVLRSLVVDAEGRLWAELRNRVGDARQWDVWTLDGDRLRVRSSLGYERVPQWAIAHDTVVGVTRDPLGRAIVVLSVLKPEPRLRTGFPVPGVRADPPAR